MAKSVFINLPVTNLERSTAFYEQLGFVKNPMFSDDHASSMQWSDEIIVMLLKHEFYQKFLQGKTIADTKSSSAVLLALSLDSKEAVQKFAETAKANGGNFYHIDSGVPEDMMFGYEVEDPDGHVWEPVWMNTSFNPQAE